MANKAHLARLQQGVEAWNRWREVRDKIKPNLTEVNLTGATLDGATLHDAHIDWTTFGNVDLSTVRGLEMVQHHGPSTVGIDTLYRSHGNIPEVFLRGAGVPDEIITYARALVERPFEF